MQTAEYLLTEGILRSGSRTNLVAGSGWKPARHFGLQLMWRATGGEGGEKQQPSLTALDSFRLSSRPASRQYLARRSESGDIAIDCASRHAQRVRQVADSRLGALRGGLLAESAQPLLASGSFAGRLTDFALIRQLDCPD